MLEKVLLVEDDEAIAAMLTVALRQWGYDVLHAAAGRSAVEISRAYGTKIGVVLCDVMLPDGPFPAVADEIRANCPGVRLIYTSGFPPDILVERGVLPPDAVRDGQTAFIPKPFLPSDVRDAVRRALLETMKTEEKVYAATAH